MLTNANHAGGVAAPTEDGDLGKIRNMTRYLPAVKHRCRDLCSYAVPFASVE